MHWERVGSTWDIQHRVSKMTAAGAQCPHQIRFLASPLAPTQEAAVSWGSWLGVRRMLQEMQAHGSRTWVGEVVKAGKKLDKGAGRGEDEEQKAVWEGAKARATLWGH